MRIALVITELDPGGAENCLVNLASYASQLEGHSVTVYVLGPPPKQTKMTERLDKAGIHWECFGATSKWSMLSALRWLKTKLREFPPDVIQSMLFHANVLTALAAPRNVPFFGGARVADPSRFRMLIGTRAAARMTKLICVSDDVAEHCRKHEAVDRSKLLVIPNGIEIPTAETLQSMPAPDGQSELLDNQPYLLFVGRLAEQKGILPLCQRVEELLEGLPNHHLVIIGDGPLRNDISKVTDSSRVARRVHRLGWIPDPRPWMLHTECLLLPAAYEGMPNVVLEAMSLAKPVASFSIEGVRELLGDSPLANHQLATPQNFDSFLSKAKLIANDANLRVECGTANRQRAIEHFNLENKMQMYLEAWHSAINK